MNDSIFSPKVCSNFVKDDGSTPFLKPQIGQNAESENQLATLGQVKKEQTWKNNKPVDGTVGFVEEGTKLPSEMNLQEVMDALFYNKKLLLNAPKQVIKNTIAGIEIQVSGDNIKKIIVSRQGITESITNLNPGGIYYVMSSVAVEPITWEVKVIYEDGSSIRNTAFTDVVEQMETGEQFQLEVNINDAITYINYNYTLYGELQDKGIIKVLYLGNFYQFTVQANKDQEQGSYTFSPMLIEDKLVIPCITNEQITFYPVENSDSDITDLANSISNLNTKVNQLNTNYTITILDYNTQKDANSVYYTGTPLNVHIIVDTENIARSITISSDEGELISQTDTNSVNVIASANLESNSSVKVCTYTIHISIGTKNIVEERKIYFVPPIYVGHGKTKDDVQLDKFKLNPTIELNREFTMSLADNDKIFVLVPLVSPISFKKRFTLNGINLPMNTESTTSYIVYSSDAFVQTNDVLLKLE